MKKLFLCIVFFALCLVGCSQKEYTVNFYDEDGTLLSTDIVKERKDATAPTPPLKEEKEFIGWSVGFTSIDADLDVYAQYANKTYLITYLDWDNQELYSQRLEKNQDGNIDLVPERTGYVFTGWSEDLTSITEDITVIAIYETIKFTVTYLDYDGSEIDTKQVEKNQSGVPGSNPNRTGYRFIGWSEDLTSITEDITVNALYEIITYTITYLETGLNINEHPELNNQTYDVTKIVFLPDIERTGYNFLGWYESAVSTQKIVSLSAGSTGNKTFYARYEKIEEKQPIVMPQGTFYFLAVKNIPHSSGNGTYVYQPDFTGSNAPSTSVLAYTWASSDTSVVTVSTYSTLAAASSGYAIISATLIADTTKVGYLLVKVTPDGIFYSTVEEANKETTYTVNFVDYAGVNINTQTIKEGATATLPTPPLRAGYVFVGWDKQHYNIQEDTTIKATYKEGSADYIGKYVSFLGDSISTYKNYVPEGYSCFYPYPTASIGDVNQTWWMQLVNNSGMKLLKNNSWSGSCVSSGTGVSSAVNDSRLIELVKGNQKPDVIVIFMGANDCGSIYVNKTTFDASYKIMLDKIAILCPDAEIILCTLAPSGLYSADAREEYNVIIRKYATDYSLKVINFESMYSQSEYTSYVCDSIHPNRNGMNAYAKKALEDLLG